MEDTRDPRRTFAALCVSCYLASACGGSPPASDITDSRIDSAGITIVTNSDATWAASPVWRVETTPRTVIGAIDGGEGHDLFMVSSAILSRDGRIFVENSGTTEIRVFDASGRFLHSIGREGQGPGEFRLLRRVTRWRGDSIAAIEVNGMVHIFDGNGEFSRMIRPTFVVDGVGIQQTPVIRGAFDTGELLAATRLRTPRDPEFVGPYRDTTYLSVFGTSRRVPHRLGRFLGREKFWINEGEGNIKFSIFMPFPLETFVVAAGAHLYVVYNERYEIQVQSPLGELEMRIRKHHVPREVRSEDTHRYRDYQRLMMSQSGIPDRWMNNAMPALEDALPETESPALFPAIRETKVDTEGCIWVREYVPEASATDWTVFGPNGVIVGRVRLPEAITLYEQVYEIGPDYVVGRVIADDAIELIHVYSLERTPSDSV